MKMYRNYDGQKATFGDLSVSATTANPDEVAAYSAHPRQRRLDPHGGEQIALRPRQPVGADDAGDRHRPL
ncbi:MAG: hypothetical protein U0736_27170 [Gemmataceae bacterium]